MLNEVRAVDDLDEPMKKEIAFAFQDAVVDTLKIKCSRALEQTGYSQLVVAGGVGANRKLREVLVSMTATRSGRVYFPPLAYCTDNGVMIAYAGALRLLNGQQDEQVSHVLPRWSLESLEALSV